MYKYTLLAQLNANPPLSKDRLRRVQQSQCEQVQAGVNTTEETGLFQECAVFISGQPVSFQLLRVQRIFNYGGQSRLEYKQPVSLKDSTKYSKVYFQMCMYEATEDGIYRYEPSKQIEYNIFSIILGVKLEYDRDTDLYTMDAEDLASVQTFIRDQRAVRVNKRTRRHTEHNETNDRVITVVHPPPQDPTSTVRKSTRQRRVISFIH